jgi:2,3-bisphosphoglycerate-independent phosphoglycerate mutase
MKYIAICPDGMADWPLDDYDGLTPMEIAHKPNMDYLAANGIIGSVQTIPEGMSPGSDTANMAVLGYDPKQYYTGRSPFEAVSMGINMEEVDLSFRCNLVTLSPEEGLLFKERVMIDHGADDISSEEAAILIAEVEKEFGSGDVHFFPGVSYRNLMLWKNCQEKFTLTPPHDILEKRIEEFLPSANSSASNTILNYMQKSYDLLCQHPINIERVKKKLHPANAIWLWGEGRKPNLMSFEKKYAITGSVISAVDLIKGIGICAGLTSADVPGANGTIDTNYKGKVEAAMNALCTGSDFVYIHIEAPDECGHKGDVRSKIKAIELIDSEVIAPLRQLLAKQAFDYRMMVLPDHPTPIKIRTHVAEPVPFCIFDTTKQSALKQEPVEKFSEKKAMASGPFLPAGYKLMDIFLEREGCCGQHDEEELMNEIY